MVSLELDLSKHCIETDIKRQHNRALSVYFRPAADKERIEQVIALTQFALESLDFAYLRSAYPSLAGHSDVRVSLVREDDRVAIIIDGHRINPAIKNNAG